MGGQVKQLFEVEAEGHDIAHHLTKFSSWCAGPAADTPEVATLAGTIDAWWPAVSSPRSRCPA